jgi:hypothetical protein
MTNIGRRLDRIERENGGADDAAEMAWLEFLNGTGPQPPPGARVAPGTHERRLEQLAEPRP